MRGLRYLWHRLVILATLARERSLTPLFVWREIAEQQLPTHLRRGRVRQVDRGDGCLCREEEAGVGVGVGATGEDCASPMGLGQQQSYEREGGGLPITTGLRREERKERRRVRTARQGAGTPDQLAPRNKRRSTTSLSSITSNLCSRCSSSESGTEGPGDAATAPLLLDATQALADGWDGVAQPAQLSAEAWAAAALLLLPADTALSPSALCEAAATAGNELELELNLMHGEEGMHGAVPPWTVPLGVRGDPRAGGAVSGGYVAPRTCLIMPGRGGGGCTAGRGVRRAFVPHISRKEQESGERRQKRGGDVMCAPPLRFREGESKGVWGGPIIGCI